MVCFINKVLQGWIKSLPYDLARELKKKKKNLGHKLISSVVIFLGLTIEQGSWDSHSNKGLICIGPL
jgi:hypothetical protein